MSGKGRQSQSKTPVPVAPEGASRAKLTSRPPAIAWLTPSEGETGSVSMFPAYGLDHAPAEPEPRLPGLDVAPTQPFAAAVHTASGDPDPLGAQGEAARADESSSAHRLRVQPGGLSAFDDRDEAYPAVDVDTRFFQAGLLTFESAHDFEDSDARVPLRLTPVVMRRRAQFATYVKVAVGLSIALCAAALVKGAIARAHPADGPRAQAAFAGSPEVVPEQTGVSRGPNGSASDPSAPAAAGLAAAAQEQIPPAAEPAAEDKPTPAETPAQRQAVVPAPEPAVLAPPQQLAQAPVARVPASTAPQPAKGPVAAAPQVVVTAPAPPIVAGTQATAEKNASQAALERGNVGASIAAGERSVALDPTDAESWLILGAAYQQQGDDHDARRCFVACVRNANRGPKRECAAMLR